MKNARELLFCCASALHVCLLLAEQQALICGAAWDTQVCISICLAQTPAARMWLKLDPRLKICEARRASGVENKRKGGGWMWRLLELDWDDHD